MGDDFEDDYDDSHIIAAPSSPSTTAPTAITSSRKRKRESDKARKLKRIKESGEENDESHLVITGEGKGGINTAIAHLDPQLIADFVGKQTKKFEKELTFVELEDRYILGGCCHPSRGEISLRSHFFVFSASAFLDTTSWQKQRSLENLSEFMESFSRYKGRGSSLKKSSEATGTPHTLIIAAAALRAADLTRAVRKFQSKENAVAKLFAKHIKLKEQAEYCKKSRIGIGVGTPERVLALMKEGTGEGSNHPHSIHRKWRLICFVCVCAGALKLEDLKRIIIDASYIDQKKRGIFEIKETQKSVMDFLCSEKLKKRILDGNTIIIFY